MVVNGKTQIASMKMVMIKRIWRRFREETMGQSHHPAKKHVLTIAGRLSSTPAAGIRKTSSLNNNSRPAINMTERARECIVPRRECQEVQSQHYLSFLML